MQQLTLGAAFSSGLAKPVDQWHEGDHWRANLQLMLFSGDPQLNEAIGAAYPLQNAAHPTGLWLTEATIERRAGSGELALKAGVFSLNPGFVRTPVLDQYVHSALNDTLNSEIDGVPINPYVAPGLQLSWTPGPQGRYGEWRYGAFWLDSQVALAAPIRRQGQTISRQLPSPQVQLGGVYLANDRSGESNGSLYGTVTLAGPLPLGLDNRFWLGVKTAVSGDTNPVHLFLAGGWLGQGLVPGRPLDVLALGYGRSSFNSQLNPGLTAEAVLELNYSFNLTANLSLQPVLQWVLNPGGSGQVDDILAAGLQLQLQF